MRLWFLGWSLAGFASAAAAPTHNGLKIVVRESFPSGTTETTEYVAGDRARTEWRLSVTVPGSDVQQHVSVHIRRCDRGKSLVLNQADRTYAATALSSRLNVIERAALSMVRPYAPSPRAPEITVETTTVDTGERKIAFGFTARRVVITRRQVSPDATEETVTDGWYIDLDPRVSCERAEGTLGRAVLTVASGTPGRTAVPPRVTFKEVGPAENGFAIDTRTTSQVAGPTGRWPSSSVVTHRLVTELTRQPLDASLFNIPPGFRSADGAFGSVAARWHRTATILRSVLASWFR